jgi:hypothetical protein
MRRGDPDVASGTFRLLAPLYAKNWMFKPGEDTKTGREIAAYCAKWITGVGRRDPFVMTTPRLLKHIFLCVTDGFAAIEKVWGRDLEGHDVYAKLVPILPKTVHEFQFDDVPGGDLLGLWQQAYILGRGYQRAFVRAEKLALWVFDQEGDNLFGWPILRAAYKPWLHKEQLEIIDGIRIERHGVGFMVVTIPKGSKTSVREKAKSLLQEARAHQKMGILVEEGTKVEILYPTGSDPKIVESINLRRLQILQVLMSEFAEHGASNVGSKALVGEKIDLYLLALQSLANLACDGVNRFLVPELVFRRWGKNASLPEFVCEDLARMTAQELGDYFAKTAPESAGELLGPIDPELMQHNRKAAHLPPIPDDDMELLRNIHDAKLEMKLQLAKQPPMLPGAVPGQPGVAQPGDQPSDEEKPGKVVPIPKAAERLHEGALTPASLWREPFQHERFADFPMMKGFLLAEPSRVWKTVVEPMRSTMARITAGRLVAMTDADLRLGDVTVPLRGKLSKKLEDPFLAAYTRGRKSVLGERARQLAGVLAAERDEDDEDEFDVEPTAKQFDWVKTLAGGFVVGMITAMKKRGIDEALTVRQAELTEAEQKQRIEKALQDLSANVLQMELAGNINRSFQTGRFDQAKAMKDEIETSFYSALMDDGTDKCAEAGGLCAQLDGEEFEFGDPHFETPSPFCAWPANCNCTQIHVFRKEAA